MENRYNSEQIQYRADTTDNRYIQPSTNTSQNRYNWEQIQQNELN